MSVAGLQCEDAFLDEKGFAVYERGQTEDLMQFLYVTEQVTSADSVLLLVTPCSAAVCSEWKGGVAHYGGWQAVW